jgi:hypothetical protein
VSAALSLPPPQPDRVTALHRVLLEIAVARMHWHRARLERCVQRLEDARRRARYAYVATQRAIDDCAAAAREQPGNVWRCRCRLKPDLTIQPCLLHETP